MSNFLLEHEKVGQKNETCIINFRREKFFDRRNYFQQIPLFFLVFSVIENVDMNIICRYRKRSKSDENLLLTGEKIKCEICKR